MYAFARIQVVKAAAFFFLFFHTPCEKVEQFSQGDGNGKIGGKDKRNGIIERLHQMKGSHGPRKLPPLGVTSPKSFSSDLNIPVDSGVKTFYPQSIWAEQQAGRKDNDRLTSKMIYYLPRSKALEVGKIVPDEGLKDFSNPRFGLNLGCMNNIEEIRLTLPDFPTESDDEEEEEELSTLTPTTRMFRYVVVQPMYSCSSASIYFPVTYGAISARETHDSRGSPSKINEVFHPDDRKDFHLGSICIQKKNLNRMLLFKIGPGAVAFKSVLSAFVGAGMSYTPSNKKFNILWAKRATPYTLATINAYQKVNHFPGSAGVGRKDNLAASINEMKRHYGSDLFDIIPTSFILPRQQKELELDAERRAATEESPIIYIVKPAAASCGNGIYLSKGPPSPSSTGKKLVCQRYVGNPLLIFGRKFDLRLYCVATSFDPLRIYVFDEGLVRFAAEKYAGPGRDLDNVHVHLTNYSVNKTAELNRASAGKNYDSDDPLDIKWSLSDLKAYLKEKHPLGEDAWKTIEKRCDDVVVKTFLSVEAYIITRIRAECADRVGRSCFELYGLDLMVDDQLKVLLIEVNIMPSLATGTSLDTAVKSRMLAHMLTLIRAVPYVRSALDEDEKTGTFFIPRGSGPTRPERIYKFGRHHLGGWRMLEKPLLRSFNLENEPDSILSRDEQLMLVEAEEELRCAGGFRCIYPHPSTVENYLPLFPRGVRRNNYLLASAVLQKKRKDMF